MLIDSRVVPITVDGLDSTVNIVNILENWEMDVVFLGGATFAGFNVVDVEQIHEATGVPVIVYMTKYPDMDATQNALRKHFPDWEERWRRYEALGDIHEIKFDGLPSTFYEKIGTKGTTAEKLIHSHIIEGRIPEPLRLANLIAKGTTPVYRGRGVTPRESAG